MLRRVSHVWEWRINVSVIEAAGADSSLFFVGLGDFTRRCGASDTNTTCIRLCARKRMNILCGDKH